MPEPAEPTQRGLENLEAVALVPTKFYVPSPRPGSVQRPALVTRLEEGVARKLTVLAAPAGAGKTTLLAEWIAASREARAFAWVSLEPSDNDPVRFWTAVVRALRTVQPGLAGRTLAALAAPNADLIDVVLRHLVSDLTELERRTVLVLDDYQAIGHPRIHESLAFLVQHAPAALHLVVASRSDPPLPLGRLRARADLTELRLRDLRFSDEESELLFNETMKLGLDVADVQRLRERTEGWAAGLYLAGLSLRGRDDAAACARTFAGDDRHVADFLASEVLDREPEPTRTFLLHTSILSRLCGDLCDAVCQTVGAGRRLQEIERTNLFLVPLDTRREWYRYHQLFADLLRIELERSMGGEVADLHARAAVWHRDHGLAVEAIRHALAAGDLALAGDLVAAHWSGALQAGQIETVEGWLEAFPADAAIEDARFCIARGWTFLFSGRPDQVLPWADRAERGRDTGLWGAQSRSYGIAPTLEAAVAVLRAAGTHLLGDLDAMLGAARSAVTAIPEGDPSRVLCLLMLGHVHMRSGHLEEARPCFDAALARAAAVGQRAVMTALAHLALLDIEHGDLESARDRCEQALRAGEGSCAGEQWMMAWPLIASGRLHQGLGRLPDARASLERAVVLARRGGARLETAEALVHLADVRRELGDREAACHALVAAESTVAACPAPGLLVRRLADVRSRVNGRPPRPVQLAEPLSERELGVLRLLPGPLSSREIGQELFISLNTVKTHLRRIYQKLGVADRREAVQTARDLGLL